MDVKEGALQMMIAGDCEQTQAQAQNDVTNSPSTTDCPFIKRIIDCLKDGGENGAVRRQACVDAYCALSAEEQQEWDDAIQAIDQALHNMIRTDDNDG